MIPAAFEYLRADTVEEALAALAELGDEAKLMAGGHSLLPMMKLRLAFPATVVDLGRLAELCYQRLDGDEVAIGALTRHCELVSSPLLAREVPLLPHVAARVGDRQIRHRGTIGGSLAHADPAADLPVAVRALGGTIVVRGPDGERHIDVADFFVDYFETALAPDEMLVEIRVPRCGAQGWAYQRFARRSHDWAIVAAATVGGRVALANMANVPTRATATERALASGASIEQAAALAADGTEPSADGHADAEYRRHLARLLTRRALESAAA
ncbi:xanthine dehydrogenase family protein subunit M [Pseudonocardia eucalypti]|uniref:Xanthine dehydrogenase family protein subunit M n=1 Tax=Pseudonocardia eucalypti TaxID=648755 RepID=A0ABP9PNV7_9PSEU|nr:carbon-monoxide dehydrogenase medium subunit [Pseudonocardia eucalypti]